MRNKGFTLIELLAVIVILAIIALIATPVILGIINNVKDESNKRSIEMYADAIENAVINYQLTSTDEIIGSFDSQNKGKQLIQEGKTPVEIDYNGNVVCDTIEIHEDGTIYLANCKVDGKAVDYTYGKSNIPEPESFATDSWETIVANINSDKYKVGNTREIELKGFENGETDENGIQIKTYTIRIANKTNTGDVCTKEYFEKEDGTKETYSKTACGFVIEFVDIIRPTEDDDAKMNLEDMNAGGWKDSKMRTYVNNTIYNALPNDLRDVIIDTTVVSGHGSTSGETNFVTTDKVYLLSTGEVWEQGISNTINNDTARYNTRQLDYYKDEAKVTTSSYGGAIKKINDSAYYWWLRSAYSNNTNYFYIVGTAGDWNYGNAGNPNEVAVAFRIG